jgi:hypothetical protein
MNVNASPPERDLLERFVRFLNLTIERTADVEELFAAATFVGAPGGLQRIPAEDVAAFQSDQKHLREVLEPLAAAFGSETRLRRAARQLQPAVAAGLGDKPVLLWFVPKRGEWTSVHRLYGVVQCCWVAVKLLSDPTTGLLGRFGRCGTCGRYNLTLKAGEKPRRHCDDDHAEAFRRLSGVKRVQRHRKKKERERKKKEREAAERAARAAQKERD